jgi:sterol O-acyltransferase
MVMKMHSYITVNGQLQTIDNEGKSLFVRLKSATEFVGGWDKAMTVASAKQAEQHAKMAVASETAENSNSELEPTPIGTPSMPEGLSASYVDEKTASALRKRLAAISHGRSSETSISTMHSTLGNESHGGFMNRFKTEDAKDAHTYVVNEGEGYDEDFKPHVLVYHPDENISTLAIEYSDLQSELVGSGPNHVKWQDTISWKNFALYQLIPTLVYELEYPRTDRLAFNPRNSCFISNVILSIRPLYVFEKTVSADSVVPYMLVQLRSPITGRHFWNLRSSLHCNRKLHPALYILT